MCEDGVLRVKTVGYVWRWWALTCGDSDQFDMSDEGAQMDSYHGLFVTNRHIRRTGPNSGAFPFAAQHANFWLVPGIVH